MITLTLLWLAKSWPRFFLLCVLILLERSVQRASAQDFFWAKQASGPGADTGRAIAVDSTGNCFVTGSFQGVCNIGGTSLTSAGGHDAFVAKFDSLGTLVWIRQIGGTNNDLGSSIGVDANGNISVAGQFSGTAKFGESEIVSAGLLDIFVVRLDAAGRFQWAKTLGGSRDESGAALALDLSGNCYVAGQFSGSSKFGDVTLTSSGQTDAFLTKLDSTGNVLWAQRAGGSEGDGALGVAVDQQGQIVITGFFQGSASFGDSKLSATGMTDILVVKYDASGQTLWASKAGGSQSDQGHSVALDASGNCYVTGNFQQRASFGSVELSDTDTDHLFIAKLDPSGGYLWARSVGQARSFGNGIAALPSGDVFVVGGFQGVARFGTKAFISMDWDLLVARFDSNGNFIWASAGGGDRFETGFGIAANSLEEPYVTGTFLSRQAKFGCVTLSRTTTDDEIFVAKLGTAITSPPQSQAVTQGGRVQFTVKSGVALASFQWQRNGEAIPGATLPELTIDNTQASDAGNYTVSVTFGDCSIKSPPATLTVNVPPSFTIQPASQVVDAGTNLTLRVTADGSPPLSYFWFLNETNILSTASGTNLVLTNVTALASGAYSAIVSNAFGVAKSMTADVLVEPRGAPRISVNGQVAPRYAFTNTKSVEVRLDSTLPNATIFYTLDGSIPDPSSTLYTAPFNLTASAVVRAIAFDSSFKSVLGSPILIELLRTFKLSATTLGGGKVLLDPPGEVYREGASVTVRAVADSGWSLLEWKGDARGTTPTLKFNIDGPKNVAAIFATSLALSVTGQGQIQLNPATASFPFGTTVRLAAVPNEGHYFALWGGDASGTVNPFSVTVTNSGLRASALFALLATNRVALTVIPSGKGTVQMQPRANSFAKGDSVVITPVPERGHQFLFWSGALNGTAAPTQITMDQSKFITAHFTGGTTIVFESTVHVVADGLGFSGSSDAAVFAIEASTNLVNWNEVMTITNRTGTFQFTESNENSKARFFRGVAR